MIAETHLHTTAHPSIPVERILLGSALQLPFVDSLGSLRSARQSATAQHYPLASAAGGVMVLVIPPRGQVRCFYSEAHELSVRGALTIQRASHAEPDASGRWYAIYPRATVHSWDRLNVGQTHSPPKLHGYGLIA